MSSARRFGGVPEDYLSLHNWFDATKQAYADQRHRAVLHNTYGIFLAEERFGLESENHQLRNAVNRIPKWLRALLGIRLPAVRPVTITNSNGKAVPIRLLAEQHVIEDCGFIPTLEDYLGDMPRHKWMTRGAMPLSRLLTPDGAVPDLPVAESPAGLTELTP